MTHLAADLRYTLRTLRRSPLFATVAVFSLAMGIGANTAIFTLIDQLVMRRLPTKDPDSLVMLYQRGAHNGNNMGDRMHSYPIYRDYQQKAGPLAEVLCRRLVNASNVRTGIVSEPAYKAIRDAVRKLDASMPVYELKTLEGQLDQTLLTERLIALLSAGFGFLATALAAIGLYGVMAFVVARRTKELGIRLALGAQRSSLVWLVMKEVLILLAIGLALGVPAGLSLGHFVAGELYGILPSDPSVAGSTVVLLLVVAVAAGLIPAHRASRVDPILALRFE